MPLDLDKMALEAAELLAPLAIDLATGRTDRALTDVEILVVKAIGRHLLAAHGAVALADLRFIADIPASIVKWIRDHPYAGPEPATMDSIEAGQMLGNEGQVQGPPDPKLWESS